MIVRALIHVAGPRASGKTTFIEAALTGLGGCILVARCIRDDGLPASRETAPRSHSELKRYRAAGASGAALFNFPASAAGSDTFFATRLMQDYSEAVLLEGDTPIAFADLAVFVAPPLADGQELFVRHKRERQKEALAAADVMERFLLEPDALTRFLEQRFDPVLLELTGRSQGMLDQMRARLAADIDRIRKGPPAAPTEHWAIADDYEGIQRAQLVVINIHDESERGRGERLTADVARLRTDRTLFDDVMGPAGKRTQVTAVVANLADSQDSGRKKALARIKRAMKKRS